MKHIRLFENYDKANKLYFFDGLLSEEDKAIVCAITRKDGYTEYVAKLAVAMKHVMKQVIQRWLSDFYYELKEYTGTVLPIKEFNKEMHNLSDEDMLRLHHLLRDRKTVVAHTKQLSSKFLRNHKEEYSEEVSINGSNDYEGLAELLGSIIYNLSVIKEDATEDEYERVENVAFSTAYKTTKDVRDFLSHYLDSVESSESYYHEMLANNELQVIGKNRHGTLVMIDSHEKMKKAFGNSAWCFSRFGSTHDWELYAPNDYVYVLEAKDDIYVILLTGKVYDSGNGLTEKDGNKILKSFGVN